MNLFTAAFRSCKIITPFAPQLKDLCKPHVLIFSDHAGHIALTHTGLALK